MKRSLNKNRFRAYAIVFAFLLSVLLIFSYKLVSRAEQTLYDVTYISVKIEEGDTLNKIASKYINESGLNHSDLVREISRINRINSDKITAGAYIILPVLSNGSDTENSFTARL